MVEGKKSVMAFLSEMGTIITAWMGKEYCTMSFESFGVEYDEHSFLSLFSSINEDVLELCKRWIPQALFASIFIGIASIFNKISK